MKRIIIIIALCATSCDAIDLGNCKKIVDNYCLEKFDSDNVYYVQDNNYIDENGGGLVNGTVLQIGWNRDVILIKRKSTFRGDPDGWMIIDVKRKYIYGPYNTLSSYPGYRSSKIDIVNASEAWNRL